MMRYHAYFKILYRLLLTHLFGRLLRTYHRVITHLKVCQNHHILNAYHQRALGYSQDPF